MNHIEAVRQCIQAHGHATVCLIRGNTVRALDVQHVSPDGLMAVHEHGQVMGFRWHEEDVYLVSGGRWGFCIWPGRLPDQLYSSLHDSNTLVGVFLRSQWVRGSYESHFVSASGEVIVDDMPAVREPLRAIAGGRATTRRKRWTWKVIEGGKC